jgi:beta-aspartyl-peptidase (threonine type)
MNKSTSRRRWLLIGSSWIAASSALLPRSAGANESQASEDDAQRQAIIQLLMQQIDAWNQGDLTAFMEPYWHSDDLTFSSGGKTTRGWQSTLDGYRARYPDRAAMGRLTMSDLEVRLLCPTVALVLGRWSLDRAEQPVGGNFSLVVQLLEERWQIIHDHTSRAP